MTQEPDLMTLKVQLGTIWAVEIECPKHITLSELHFAIQESVEFDNDHLYEFYVARNERARNRITYDAEGADFDTPLHDIFPLPKKHRLYYLFDYGDCWLFRVSLTRKKLKKPLDGVEYPRVVKESGAKPVQYEMDDF